MTKNKVVSLDKYREDKQPHFVIDVSEFSSDSTTGAHVKVCPVEMFKHWFRGEIKVEESDPLVRYIIREWLIMTLQEAGTLEQHEDIFNPFHPCPEGK